MGRAQWVLAGGRASGWQASRAVWAEWATREGAVVGIQGLHEAFLVQAQLACQLGQGVGAHAREDRRHEAAYGLGVDDGPGGLARLLGHQAAPDGIALGPEVLALVIEALGLAVDHHAQRDAE